jgi:hypothetical protein
MEYQVVTPEQDNWEKQINITAYYGNVLVGSIVFYGDEIGWQSVIDGSMDYLEAETEEEAKQEMKDKLQMHFESQISYYKELEEMLEEI